MSKDEALKLALGYMKQILMEHDEKYYRHPATEMERAAIVSDIEEVEKALAEQPAQHIEHCIWARNGNRPCPHVQPAQQENRDE